MKLINGSFILENSMILLCLASVILRRFTEFSTIADAAGVKTYLKTIAKSSERMSLNFCRPSSLAG
jgi:hypothetical protein